MADATSSCLDQVDRLRDEFEVLREPISSVLNNAEQTNKAYEREVTKNQQISRNVMNEYAKMKEEITKFRGDSSTMGGNVSVMNGGFPSPA
jgi:chorismate synthase